MPSDQRTKKTLRRQSAGNCKRARPKRSGGQDALSQFVPANSGERKLGLGFAVAIFRRQRPECRVVKQWIQNYLAEQKRALDSIDLDQVGKIAVLLREAVEAGRRIFVFGNGGSAANASHFATDLGKGASDALDGKRFQVLSLNDNVSWMTALGNDYAYEDVFWRQLENYAAPKDVALALSVSGDSPNVVKAVSWAKERGLQTIALVGAKRGALAMLAQEVVVVDSEHYGRVEDVQMGICHMLCYAFMEKAGV